MNPLPQPNFFVSLPFDIPVGSFVWGVTAFALLIYVAITLIFLYHWKKFGTNKKLMKKVMIIYFVGSLILVALVLFFAADAVSVANS